MRDKNRIVIAEDHTILREGLRALLSSHPDLEVVGEAADGRDAIRCVEEEAPDLVLLDLSMPRMDAPYNHIHWLFLLENISLFQCEHYPIMFLLIQQHFLSLAFYEMG